MTDDPIVKKDLKETIEDHFMMITDGVEAEVRHKIEVIKPENIKVSKKTRQMSRRGIPQAAVVVGIPHPFDQYLHLQHLHPKERCCKWTIL